MIRIGVDCRPLIGNRAGIGRYLYEILRELAARNDDVEYYLYSPREFELPEPCRNNARFIVRQRNFRPALVWLHAIVPFWVLVDKIDIFWGPNYALPLLSLRHHRTVVTMHDAVYLRYPQTMHWKTRLHHRFFLPRYGKKADLIITDSKFSLNELGTILGIDRIKLGWTYLAGFQEPANDIDWAALPVPRSYILAVGTVEPRKNLETLVAAYSELPDNLRENYALVIVGALGWGGLDPQQWFQKYSVAKTSYYLGKVADDVLSSLYRSASVFVFPSLYEGFGLPVVEAMSLGVPVLCSYSSALGEIASEAALQFNPTSRADLTLKLEKLLTDKKLRTDFAKKSRKSASRFAWEYTAKNTLEKLLGGLTSVRNN